VEIWEAEFVTAPIQKRLAMFYLANDVLQVSRKKGPEFVNEYYRTLPKLLKRTLKGADERTRRAVERLIDVWTERKVG
jgi:regulator of Ty1 transposition protein 103